jgi:glycosyltransferase involved in cell wall biosynthesis
MVFPFPKAFRTTARSFIIQAVMSPRFAGVRHRFPVAMRQKVLDILQRPVHGQLGFPRTPVWSERTRPASRLAAVSPEPKVDAVDGVNIYGYFSRWMGLGECARLYANALLASGRAVALYDVDIDIPHAERDTTMEAYMGRSPSFGWNLIFINPDHWEEALPQFANGASPAGRVIGYWFWELEAFPETWLPALDRVDEIMVSSAFVAEALRKVCGKPVTRVPLPLVVGDDSGLQRCHFGLREDDYVFFCSFDFNSSIARKNPWAVMEAFRQAFPRGDEKVTLLIKSSNGKRHGALFLRMLAMAASDKRIVVRDDMLERPDLQALHRCIDVYVSLHRCEGFGLGMAEAMCIGKPVVATAYSGNMEFMTPDNSCLVDYRMIEIQAGDYPHGTGQQWADPDPAHAASYMRALHQDREWAERIGAQARLDMARDFSVKACMKVLATRLPRLDCKSPEPV